MMTRIHMQDQVHNRIEDLMQDHKRLNWDEISQDIVTFGIITVFIMIGLNW